MFNKTPLLIVVSALCAILIVLRLTVLRTSHTSDLSLGLSIGVLIALSILSVISLRRETR